MMVLVAATLVMSLAPAFGQVDTAWVRRWDGPNHFIDQPSDLVVDRDGNVYVTGHTWSSNDRNDYLTIKYDASGNELWVKRYNGLGNGDDDANAIAVDDSGNVYVTGSADEGSTYDDYLTIKYYPNGDTAWVRRYNGPGNSDDQATAIAIDDSGYVYVTGSSYDLVHWTRWDYATIKYAPDGTELWVQRYNGPALYLDDKAVAIAVDRYGNVYVTGSSVGDGTDFDYATIKYYPSGGFPSWVARYNGPANGDDKASSMAVDESGNVYVTGWSKSVGSDYDYDYTTIKYYSYGDTAWVRRYNGPENYADAAYDIAVDVSGNVYVTGVTYDSAWIGDYATIMYYPDGETAWIRKYDSPVDGDDAAKAIAVDDRGNVFVTGPSVGNGSDYDYATVNYYLGNEIWVRRYNGPGNARDGASSIAVDDSGNVYVTGWSEGIGTYDDYATIKYLPTWVARGAYQIISPDSWLKPPLKVTPNIDLVLTFKVMSIGNANLIYSVSSDDACIQVSVPPTSLPGGQFATVTVNVIGTGACNNSFIDGNVIITTNEGGGKVDSLPVQAVVSNDYYECPVDPATEDTLYNGVMLFYANSNCQEWMFDSAFAPDTCHEVFSNGGTFVAVTQSGDTLAGRFMGDNDQNAGARQLLYKNSMYTDFWLEYTWNTYIHKLNPPMNDKWWWWEILKEIVFFKPNAANAYKHSVIKFITVERHDPPTWWPSQPTFTNYEDTYIGIAMDIDCPWDTALSENGRNLAYYDATKNIAYQQGYDYTNEHPQYDNYVAGIALIQGRQSGESTIPYGAYNVKNHTHLFHQGGWRWLDGDLYRLAKDPLPADIEDPDSVVDRTQVFTARKIAAGTNPNARASFTVVEVAAYNGLAQLQAYVDSARAWVAGHKNILCGDANNSGVIEVGDITTLISYLYKGGQPPAGPMMRGDANNSTVIEVGDITTLISYLYKGGQAPLCPGIW